MKTPKAPWSAPTLTTLGSIDALTQMPPGQTPPGKTIGGNDAMLLRGGPGDFTGS